MTRIAGGGVSARNPFGPQWSARAEKASSVGDQVHLTLFGKKKPQKLDIEDMETDRLMALMTFTQKLPAWRVSRWKIPTHFSGLDHCHGRSRWLDLHCKSFLHAHKDNHPVLAGARARNRSSPQTLGSIRANNPSTRKRWKLCAERWRHGRITFPVSRLGSWGCLTSPWWLF